MKYEARVTEIDVEKPTVMFYFWTDRNNVDVAMRWEVGKVTRKGTKAFE